jgi:hypothetical protein
MLHVRSTRCSKYLHNCILLTAWQVPHNDHREQKCNHLFLNIIIRSRATYVEQKTHGFALSNVCSCRIRASVFTSIDYDCLSSSLAATLRSISQGQNIETELESQAGLTKKSKLLLCHIAPQS